MTLEWPKNVIEEMTEVLLSLLYSKMSSALKIQYPHLMDTLFSIGKFCILHFEL